MYRNLIVVFGSMCLLFISCTRNNDFEIINTTDEIELQYNTCDTSSRSKPILVTEEVLNLFKTVLKAKMRKFKLQSK